MAQAEKVPVPEKFRSPRPEFPVTPTTQSDFNLLTSVRAKLAKRVAHPAALETRVANGHVWIRGPILGAEVDRLVSDLLTIPGLIEIDDHFDVLDDSSDTRLRLGEWKEDRLKYQPEFFQGLVATPVRVAIAATGLGLLGLSLKNRGATRVVLSVLALGAVARAITNLGLTQMIGAITVPAMRLRRSLRIAAPPELVYAFWKDFSNYPKFMSFIREVRVNEQGGLHWTAVGPKGVPVGWDAVVGAMIENQRISWHSSPSSLVANEGTISISGDTLESRLDIELTYALPGGLLGYALVRVLGFDPRQKIDEDLEVMRKLIEGESASWLSSSYSRAAL